MRRATLPNPGIRIRHAAQAEKPCKPPRPRSVARFLSCVWRIPGWEGGCGSCGIMPVPVIAFIVSLRTRTVRGGGPVILYLSRIYAHFHLASYTIPDTVDVPRQVGSLVPTVGENPQVPFPPLTLWIFVLYFFLFPFFCHPLRSFSAGARTVKVEEGRVNYTEVFLPFFFVWVCLFVRDPLGILSTTKLWNSVRWRVLCNQAGEKCSFAGSIICEFQDD